MQLYATGLGVATPNGSPNGVAPPGGSVIYGTVSPPAVTVVGQPAKVQFSGIAPGFPGLHQVNFQIPPATPAQPSGPAGKGI